MGSEEGPPEEAERLSAFIGEWQVEGLMSDGSDHFSVAGQWRFTEAIDGWGINGSMQTDIQGMGSFEECELIGFDAVRGKVHMFSMNRFAIRDHVGGWKDESTLTTEYEDEDDGSRTQEVITVRFNTPDRMSATVVEQVDGQTVLTTDLELQRLTGA